MKIDPALVRKLRQHRHWSQEQLGAACGLNLRTIQRLEKSGNASLESVRALAAVFGVEAGELVQEGGPGPGTPWDAVRAGFARYADFAGTSTRYEYWWFFLFVMLLASMAELVSTVLSGLFLLAVVVPLAAAGSRRLNDTGQSPWWQLMFLVPFGFVVPLCLLAMPARAAAT
jgi:transcriptional regulator with XRE-family HTH domain